MTIAGAPASAAALAPTLGQFGPQANASDISGDRSLLPATEQLSVNAVMNRTLFGDISATVNGSASVSTRESLLGPAQARLSVPAGNPFSPFAVDTTLYRYLGELGPLQQSSRTVNGHLGATFDGPQGGAWRWNLTAVYDHDHSLTRTDRGADLTALQAGLDARDPRANPYALSPATPFLRDRARSDGDSGGADLLVSGTPLRLPAGDVSLAVKVGAAAARLESESLRSGTAARSHLSRTTASARINLDAPITSVRNGVLDRFGDLSANLNLAIDHLSDFGDQRTLGAGLNWTPIRPVNLIVSYTEADDAPSMTQLGGPLLVTPDSREFDYRTGQTVTVARVSGGNRALRAEQSRTLKLGLTLRPPQVNGLSVTANYFRTRTDDPIADFPGGVAAIEAAFPDRFVRDAAGVLQRVDARPVNFRRQASDQIRWGFNFSRQIGKTPEPTPEQRAAMRAFFERRQAAAAPGDDGGPPRRPGQGAEAGGGPGGERGPGGRGPGGFGGGPGGFGAARALRVQIAVYQTLHLREDVLIRDGLPVLDLLKGGSLGAGGGAPRQEVEIQGGVSKNGMGARISAKWQDATTVDGGVGPASQLRFSDLATINLRLFADLGLQRTWVQAHPFLRGARLSLSVNNLFDERLSVRDATGSVPIRYQPDYLDPLGRTVQITFRKQFFPAPGPPPVGRRPAG